MNALVSKLLGFEKFAIAILFLLLLLLLVHDPLYRMTWIGGLLLLALVAVTTFAGAVAGVIDGVVERASLSARVRKMAAVPLALLLFFLAAQPVGDLGRWSFGYLHFLGHRNAIEQDVREAGGAPMSWRYLEGIPDGGVAIVHTSGRRPENLSPSAMIDLVGEGIRSCRRLVGDFYLCVYD